MALTQDTTTTTNNNLITLHASVCNKAKVLGVSMIKLINWKTHCNDFDLKEFDNIFDDFFPSWRLYMESFIIYRQFTLLLVMVKTSLSATYNCKLVML